MGISRLDADARDQEDAASRIGAADATLFDDVLSSSPDRKEGNRLIRNRFSGGTGTRPLEPV